MKDASSWGERRCRGSVGVLDDGALGAGAGHGATECAFACTLFSTRCYLPPILMYDMAHLSPLKTPTKFRRLLLGTTRD